MSVREQAQRKVLDRILSSVLERLTTGYYADNIDGASADLARPRLGSAKKAKHL